MSCVTSPTCAILINGGTTHFFRSSRGLQQGCPLSPLLFIMVMEGFSLLLKKSKGEKKITRIRVSKMINIWNLFFVDDVLILTKADLQEWREIYNLIVLFCKASGLQVNTTKTTMHFDGLSERLRKTHCALQSSLFFIHVTIFGNWSSGYLA